METTHKAIKVEMELHLSEELQGYLRDNPDLLLSAIKSHIEETFNTDDNEARNIRITKI